MGVVVPVNNVTPEAEMDDLRPRGVVNATARIANPDRAVAGDADAAVVRAAVAGGPMGALDMLAPARPGGVAIGVMVENVAGGGAAGEALLAIGTQNSRRPKPLSVPPRGPMATSVLAAPFAGIPANGADRQAARERSLSTAAPRSAPRSPRQSPRG
ncbi:hypothetical protein GCM10011320_51170 [Neoroseomonas lacus]|uniref:Uncharacterized protein n=1 Tax=Neoroseomonas lacus TaxID=287609 RepID=A0A917KZ83_9PROT|nr:hypothetical protein GCM10011320_51170 [Neoroseomonas lacus]